MVSRTTPSTKYNVIITTSTCRSVDGFLKLETRPTDPVHKDTIISVIPTAGSQEDRQRALSLGANAYITKPIQAPQVIAKVRASPH